MDSDLASTNRGFSEGFVPEQALGRLIEVEQVSRYLWAAQVATGRRVLDAGSGTGYGSRLLAAAGAQEVVGVEVARGVLEMAAPDMPESILLQTGDLRKLEFADDTFELIVCFEVIEYIEDPISVLDELVRVLAPGGLLIVSTPSREAQPPGSPFLLHALAPEELEATLAARLSHVRLVRQRDYVVSALLASGINVQEDGGVNDDLVLHKLAADTMGDTIYMVAMASDAELPAMRDLAAMGATVGLQEWLSALETQTATISEKDHQIHELQARVEEHDRLTKLLAEAEHRSAEVQELKLRIADLEFEVEAARSAAAAARQEADQLDRMLLYGRRMLRFVRPLIKPLRRLRRKLHG